MKRLLAIALIIIATTSYAAIYVTQDKAGNVEYTDSPTGDAKEVQVSPLNTVTTNTPSTAPASEKPEAGTVESISTAKEVTPGSTADSPAGSAPVATVSTLTTYKTFNITSPADGASIQNQPVIPVEMQIDPPMVAGDKIQLYLDGKASGVPSSTIYQELGLVERGTHSVYAEIINSQQKAIKKSNTITIYVHRNSVITNPANK